MKAVDKVLVQIEECIKTNTFQEAETDKIELKDLSGGEDWKEMYKSVCAFLNSQGGTIIIGIKENNNKTKYTLTGYNSNNENNLKELPNKFTNDLGQKIDLSEYIRPDLFEIKDFLNERVCILYIDKLPEDKKYVMFDGVAYERKLTGDHKIKESEIEKQRELRLELESVRELRTVDGTTIEDLDIDKLNDFIQKLNQGGPKVETLKPDINSALSFLERKKFIVDGKPTLLGILVCGKNIFDLVESRCQVDCFVTSPIQIASNKKIFKDNIISLLESSIGFVFTNIDTGISSEKGGSTTFEYPERLIRETVNNALAHRDYGINKFVNITIHPNKQIEIRNPGKFRQEQIMFINGDTSIRRIIPLPKARNPRLADVLKTFDRWEGKGWGMSSLTNMALENQIDLPYYVFYAEQDVGLFIPKGKVLDDEMQWWLTSFEGYIFKKTNGKELDNEQKTALAYFLKSERINKSERYTIALTPDNNHFSVIAQLEKWGLIYKLADSPQLYPIYVVDRTLTNFDFIKELRGIFGGSYDDLKPEYKEILNVIFHFNNFGKTINTPSASQVGNFLFFKKYKNVYSVEEYNEFKRKIRRLVNNITSRGLLIQLDKGTKSRYVINNEFGRTKSLFD
jgi:ATP-dependent DNA helicase RecG